MGNIESRNDNVKTVRKRDKSNFSRIGHSHVKTNSIYPDRIDNTCSYNIKTLSNLTILGGRPYLDDDVSIYLFPADWEEADRVQACHFALKHLLGGNYTAPLSNILKPESKILNHQWVPLLNEIMRVLKPGGIVEFVEFDLILEALYKKKQIDLLFLPKFEQTIKDVGFQNVNCNRKTVSLGK
ncbi:19322_t:CDS:2 [Racocetra persica]|uniref:19322_t:CDS:1 n=2 Tax=Racocetra persica TaxID=160502 RepID=A0ACA9KRF8_9GLOM|nr:19321_t:CDS:2 [Racocetra persica]CAG8487178.1 19322_t:CDS:2 [Racocetra persica]